MYPVISTTIKQPWMNEILAGTKTSEYKIVSKHWRARLGKLVGYNGYMEIHFNCGRKTYRYHVLAVKKWIIYPGNKLKNIDGKDVERYYEIALGHRLCNKSSQNQGDKCKHLYGSWECGSREACILEASR